MTVSRRGFLVASAGAAGALSLGSIPLDARWVQSSSPRPRGAPGRILILGGTSFLGPHQVKTALERGYDVSIFNRGRTIPLMYPELFEHVEHLVGDRNGDLEALRGRTWDVVIDNSGQRVEWTRASATLLQHAVARYVYTSSTGVYYPYLTTDIRESVPPLLKDDPPQERPSYGVMKALSEIEVRQAFPNGAIVLRPGYIVGPGDTTDRFPYWPVRIARGGAVLVPGKLDDAVQYIDVRDLTDFLFRLVEDGETGTYNVVGPATTQTMAEFVYGVRAVTTTPTDWHWIDDYDFLTEQKLTDAIPWILPRGDELGSMRINNDAARARGLTFRPLATTAADVLEWWHSPAVSEQRRNHPRFVLTPARETEILAAWQARPPSR